MKGIILAGGSGTRLNPITLALSKQLVPIADKPMIYYPLSTLLLAGIRDILIITTREDQASFKRLLGNGSRFGANLDYAIQDKPNGIAEAFILGRDFIGKDNCSLVLGDNLFFGQNFSSQLEKGAELKEGALIFGYRVKDPERYGVAEIDKNNNVLSIEEKPKAPKSSYAVTGLYFYDNKVVDYARDLKPSHRNEIEITDLNNLYLKEKKLKMEIFGRGFAWLDTGTHQSLMDASNFINTIENRQGFKIGCIEEVAFRRGFISLEQFKAIGMTMKNNQYGVYILELIEREFSGNL